MGYIRWIVKLLAVDNLTALFEDDMNVLQKKYLNLYCFENGTEAVSIKTYTTLYLILWI